MNNRISIVLLAALALVSVFLIYEELQAAPLWCWTAENYCRGQCWCNFSLDYCWENPINGGLYCYFSCTGFETPCGWLDPTYGICFFGPPK